MLKINSIVLGLLISFCLAPVAQAANIESKLDGNSARALLAQFGQTANQRQQAEYNRQSNDYQSYLYHQEQLRRQQNKDAQVRQLALEFTNKRDYIGLGSLYYSNGYMRDAITAYTTVIEINPKSFDGYFLRARAKSYQGDLRGAITDYDTAIALNPESDGAYTNRAIAKYKLKDKDGSLQDFRSAARIYKATGNMKELNDVISRIQYLFKISE
jgi:tetratricopeptide (TPR) repeat protein